MPTAAMRSLGSVPLVNSDQLDKLAFVAHKPFAFRTCSDGLSCLLRHLLSEPCGPPGKSQIFGPYAVVKMEASREDSVFCFGIACPYNVRTLS